MITITKFFLQLINRVDKNKKNNKIFFCKLSQHKLINQTKIDLIIFALQSIMQMQIINDNDDVIKLLKQINVKNLNFNYVRNSI